MAVVGVASLVAIGGVHELRTSHAQSLLFTRISAGFGFELGDGPSDLIRFPSGGPYDERLGYARIPTLVERWDSAGFEITQQARLTRSLARWVDRGLYPIHREKGPAGLRVYDRAGQRMLEERFPRFAYAAFDSVPEVVWGTLLFVETQGLLDAGAPRRNPAVEWDRLALGAAALAISEVAGERNVPGGSTLATQLEKYRHWPGGRTRSPGDKLSQMLTASLRAYSEGPETYEQRRRIVVDYLNSVPLAGQAGWGEVAGIGEGLRSWYGTPFDHANTVLASEPTDALARVEHARIYRQVLTLLVAQRRPSHFLAHPDGRAGLESLTDSYLRLLERAGMISSELAEDARRVGAQPILTTAPPSERPAPRGASKGVEATRAHLLGLTGSRDFYELDRLDLSVGTTLDRGWDSTTASVLEEMRDARFLAEGGFLQQGLLARGDPAKVLYSVLMLERTDWGDAIRIQADNFPGDMRFAEGSRLELGSTAKLRTLVTYLEVIGELHARYTGVSPDSLARLPARDALARWVLARMADQPDIEVEALLEAAMERSYSASPRERFFTGGAELTFSNFDNQFDQRVLSVREAFRHSVNLPFIRLMRDVVEHEVARLPTSELIERGDTASRRQYLVRFAEHEGAQYVRRYHRRYRDRSGHEVLESLLGSRSLSSSQVAWAVRAVAPDAPYESFADLVRRYGPDESVTDAWLLELHRRTHAGDLPLSDLGYLSRVHPLELWVASQRLHQPGAGLPEVLEGSREVVLDVYGWLLRTSRPRAQDLRIRSVLEMDAFQAIHARWRRLGYPFEHLTPSLATAIGSSGDRPLALAQLAGLIQNGGVAMPIVRFDEVRFGEGTPFETRLALRPSVGEQVLDPAVARVVERSLFDVVASGTGRRGQGALEAADGPLEIGGKTGTGDNRSRAYDDRGRLVATHVMNRTATFVFVAGDRYFGVVTAHVEGRDADDFRFTSALPVQLLKALGSRLEMPPALVEEPPGASLAGDPDEGPWPLEPSVRAPVVVGMVVSPLVEDHVHERP